MRRWIIPFMALVLTGCISTTASQSDPSTEVSSQAAPQEKQAINPQLAAELKDLGRAPELKNEVWLNTDGPLRLADLRGKVVLLEMWTFG